MFRSTFDFVNQLFFNFLILCTLNSRKSNGLFGGWTEARARGQCSSRRTPMAITRPSGATMGSCRREKQDTYRVSSEVLSFFFQSMELVEPKLRKTEYFTSRDLFEFVKLNLKLY